MISLSTVTLILVIGPWLLGVLVLIILTFIVIARVMDRDIWGEKRPPPPPQG